MHSSEVNIPWLPWHLVHLLLQTLCKTCQKKIQNIVHILHLYSSILRCATNLYQCPMPRCHTHISKFWWAISFLFFRPSGESSGWKWRVSPSDWSGCTVGAHMVVHPHTFITTYTHPHHKWCKTFSHWRHSHMTQGDASMCFSRTVSANLVPQLTSCLAEAPVAACSHGAQACPMLGCAHCRFCLAIRSSSKGVALFLVVWGLYTRWQSMWGVAWMPFFIESWQHARWRGKASLHEMLLWTAVFSRVFRREWWRGSLLWTLCETSSFGQKPWTWEIAFEDVAPCMT